MHDNFKHNNNIDKVVKDALEDYQVPFKEEDWLFLAEGLNQQDKYLAMLSKQRWMTGIAAVLLLTAGISLYAALHVSNSTAIPSISNAVKSLSISDLYNDAKNETSTPVENQEVLLDNNQLNRKQPSVVISSENQTVRIQEENKPVTAVDKPLNTNVPLLTKAATLPKMASKTIAKIVDGASFPQENLTLEPVKGQIEITPEVVKPKREFADLVTVPLLSAIETPLMQELLSEQSKIILQDLPTIKSPLKKELATKLFIEANFVNEHQYALGFSVGNSVGIRSRNQHWLFETGLYYGRKRFLLPNRVLHETFSIGNRNIPATIIVKETNLDMVEVPFNIQYQVNLVRRHKPFIGLGTSIYFPLYESHAYDIEAIEPINGVEVENTIINLIDDRKVTKKYYAGIVSMNFGSTYQVNERMGVHWAVNYKTSLTKKPLNQPLQVNAYYLRTVALELGFQYHF